MTKHIGALFRSSKHLRANHLKLVPPNLKSQPTEATLRTRRLVRASGVSLLLQTMRITIPLYKCYSRWPSLRDKQTIWLTFRRPILTYKRRGCSKPGITPAQHEIIHQSNKVPRLLDGEPVLGFLPVRATLDMGYEYLAKESRVNYARLEFVEHHVPVCFVGRVSPKDFEYFCDRRRRGIDDS